MASNEKSEWGREKIFAWNLENAKKGSNRRYATGVGQRNGDGLVLNRGLKPTTTVNGRYATRGKASASGRYGIWIATFMF